MQHIETVTVGSGGASSITFSSIPDTYTDLLLVMSARTTRAEDFGDVITIRPNNSTTGVSGRRLYGTGSTAVSNTTSFIPGGQASTTNQTANTFGNSAVYIPNYRSSVAKSFSLDGVSENNAASTIQIISAGLWTGTDPISSLVLVPEFGSFVQYSSASLYGIRKYNTTLAPKASGGIISYDSVNNKWVHVFTASGTFTPTENLSTDVIIVSGGGGGSNTGGVGAGGGGGALVYTSGVSVTSATTVTVGAGGAADTTSTGPGASGSSSSFGATTATVSNGAGGGVGTGGNGGASLKTINGTTTNYTGGTGTGPAPNRRGGSGAGSGANGSSSYPAIGGNGVQFTDWNFSTSVNLGYLAGGGAGGYEQSGTQPRTAGGLGGGGEGGRGTTAPFYDATNGQVNTGGGGGGCGGLTGVVGGQSGAGGSGIVIVRYSA